VSVVGLDLGHSTVRDAERWLADVPAVLGHPAGLVACTHLVPGTRPRFVLSLSAPATIDLAALPPRPAVVKALDDRSDDGAADGRRLAAAPTSSAADGRRLGAAPTSSAALDAAAEHAARRSGRAVLYPGVRRLVGRVTVAELIGKSAIERVVLHGSPDAEPAPDVLVETRGYVRPQWMDGALTLVAVPAADGRIAPLEAPKLEAPELGTPAMVMAQA
jgi:hypothetical protein